MATRDEYVAQMKVKLDEWNAQIDELEAKARQARAQAAHKHQERIAELKRKRDQAQGKLKEIQAASEGAWEGLKLGAEQIWDDFKSTLQVSKEAFFEGLREDEK